MTSICCVMLLQYYESRYHIAELWQICVSLRINKSLLKGQWFYDYLDLVDGSYLDSDDYYDDYNKAINDGICEICNYIKQDSRH